jgi:hypothetical protein
MKKVDKSSYAGKAAGYSTTVHCRPVSQPIAKHSVSRRAFVLTRNVTKKECPWLDRPFKKNETVFEYTGCTYGCISWNGTAFTEKENETPFFELPNDAVCLHGG